MIPQSKGGGRWPLLRYLLNDMDHGEIFTDEESKKLKNGYSYIKSKWWRFIPKKELNDPDDVNKKYNWAQMYSIDGERYPICPIQCCTINKIFSVYSDNSHDAFYILTPHFMEKLLNVRSKLKCGMMFGFKNSKLFVAIDNRVDSFEYDVFKPIDEEKISKDIEEDIKIIIDFIDDLNLLNDLFK